MTPAAAAAAASASAALCVLQAAAFMVFLLPGLLLMNAADIKHRTIVS
jgi:hypothetical protein